ncbi:MAG: riboflavin biosynthesis protein RibF [Clostridia bacterium]|nr:riboflavin biosynthesis protein RibF [Clostridia bacterium]
MSADKQLTFFNLDTREPEEPSCALALAIGNFDGVHLGHRRLVMAASDQAVQLSASLGEAACGVFCFLEPPADFLSKDPSPHIYTFEKKLELLHMAGAKYAVVGDFESLRHLSAKDFAVLLRDSCHCRAVSCGFNFRFGQGGAGGEKDLREVFGDMVTVLDAVRSEDGIPISSSRIRSLLHEGDIEKANSFLGSPFTIEGEVIHGKALGRRLGLPTLNQKFGNKMIVPKTGIYVSRVIVGNRSYRAVTNIGTRPTFEDSGEINCETHLLDFDGELYGEKIAVELLFRLRGEKKFASEKELCDTIENDIRMADKYFEEKAL